jgi:DNA replication protein DnaC
MTLDFLKDASNVVLVGPNGVGKTMCACNLGYQAVLAGHTVLFITATNRAFAEWGEVFPNAACAFH